MQLDISSQFQSLYCIYFIIASPKKSAKVHPPQCLDLALPGRQTHLLDPVVVISHIDRCVLSMFIGLKRSKPPISFSTLTGLVDVWGEGTKTSQHRAAPPRLLWHPPSAWWHPETRMKHETFQQRKSRVCESCHDGRNRQDQRLPAKWLQADLVDLLVDGSEIVLIRSTIPDPINDPVKSAW